MAVYTYLCFEVIDGEQGEIVGGAPDIVSAVEIASAYFISKQAASASTHFAVSVFEGGVSIATIGKSPIGVGVS